MRYLDHLAKTESVTVCGTLEDTPRAALTPVKEARLREHLTIVRKSYGQGESERVELFRETLPRPQALGRPEGLPQALPSPHGSQEGVCATEPPARCCPPAPQGEGPLQGVCLVGAGDAVVALHP